MYVWWLWYVVDVIVWMVGYCLEEGVGVGGSLTAPRPLLLCLMQLMYISFSLPMKVF